jgi:hypothetical protein
VKVDCDGYRLHGLKAAVLYMRIPLEEWHGGAVKSVHYRSLWGNVLTEAASLGGFPLLSPDS